MKQQISQGMAAFYVIMAAIIFSLGTVIVTTTLVGEREHKAGVEEGRGQVLEAVTGEAYELRLYGYKDGKVYELEGSYGYSVNGHPVIHRLPTDVRRGDTAICVRPEEEIRIIPRM